MSDAAGTDAGVVGVSSVTTDSARRDVRYEVLDMNSQGMYLCQTQHLDDAEKLLTQAYNLLENDNTIQNAQLVDQLRSTTLNNLGVVECHKGLHKQALNHLEVAQTLEQQWNLNSPSVSLNICAACNALGIYDRATTAALDTIEMLRHAAQQQQHNDANQPSDSGGDAGEWKGNPADGENNVLWGAAWHNLAVAQLNSANGKDISEYTNTFAIFTNAMQATIKLLGIDHPMTKAVHETYRSVRSHLREAGVYHQHRALLTAELPPVSGKKPLPPPENGMTVSATARRQDKDLHITLRGKETGGKKVVERYDSQPHPSIGVGSSPRRPGQSPRASPRGPVKPAKLQGIPLSDNLLAASILYRNPHPLLLHPTTVRNVEYLPRADNTASSARKGGKYVNGDPLPEIEGTQKSEAGASSGRVQGKKSAAPKEHLVGDDMWVEAVEHTSSPRAPRAAGQQQRNTVARPIYSQQLYALDSTGDGHKVAQPWQTAHMDTAPSGTQHAAA